MCPPYIAQQRKGKIKTSPVARDVGRNCPQRQRAIVALRKGDMEHIFKECSEDFLKNWTSIGSPFESLLEKVKTKLEPQKRMSVIEVVFCHLFKSAIDAAFKNNLKESTEIAAFMTGYLSSMRMMPKTEEIKSAIPGAAGNSPAEDGSPNKRMSAIDENNIIESSTASC